MLWFIFYWHKPTNENSFFFFNKWKLLRIMVIFFHLQSYFTWNAWDIKHQSFHWLSNFVILNRNWSLATNLNYIAGYKMKSFCASFPSLSPKRKKKKMPNVHTNLCLFYWVFEQCSIYLFPYWIIAINHF